LSVQSFGIPAVRHSNTEPVKQTSVRFYVDIWLYTVMANSSVGLVWHKSLANLSSIVVDPLFPSFLVCRKLMNMQFFVHTLSIFIVISPIILAKHRTAVRHDCLHEMPRFHVTFAKMAISSLRPISLSYNSKPEVEFEKILTSFLRPIGAYARQYRASGTS